MQATSTPSSRPAQGAEWTACLLEVGPRCGLDDLALWARVAVGTQMAAITAVVDGCAHVIASSGVASGGRSHPQPFCGVTIGEPSSVLCVPDASEDPRFASHPGVTGAPWLRFYAGVTLATADGRVPGVLCVGDPRPRPGLVAREVHALTGFAAEVMRRVETWRE